MAFSRSYSALASALLIGSLTLTGCGASPEEAQKAVASASASVTQANLEGVQKLADDYATAMTSDIDPLTLQSQLTEDEKAGFASIFSGANSTIDTIADVEKFVSQLSPEDKATLRKVIDADSMDPNTLIDHGTMSDDKALTVDFLNLILHVGLVMEGDVANLDNNTINLEELSLEGNQVDIPVKALAELPASTESMQEFFSHIPAVYVDGAWKIDGEKYLEKMDAIRG